MGEFYGLFDVLIIFFFNILFIFFFILVILVKGICLGGCLMGFVLFVLMECLIKFVFFIFDDEYEKFD